MERFIGLADLVKSREPSVNEALELLICIATGQYGVEPDRVRTTLGPGSRIGPALTELPIASAYILAACAADAARIVGFDHCVEPLSLAAGDGCGGAEKIGGLDNPAYHPQYSYKPPVSDANSGRPDFRQVRWGMSRSEVIEAERLNLATGPDDTLFAFDTVMGRRVAAVYQFIGDRLGRAGYYGAETNTDPDSSIVYTNQLVAAMTDRYGAPTLVHEWRNGLLRHFPSKYSLALCGGDLTIKNHWETDRTLILQITRGVNYKIRVAAIYVGKEYEKEFQTKATGDIAEIPGPEFTDLARRQGT